MLYNDEAYDNVIELYEEAYDKYMAVDYMKKYACH